jgi:heterodisulfide reductase subunit A-like polyferredoxin
MVADSSFIMDIVVKECSDVFRGISSLVDVAGGLGGATQTIAKAFPHVECSVLELPHVVANAPTDTNVKYITGDMFESIPSANAVFLKVRPYNRQIVLSLTLSIVMIF